MISSSHSLRSSLLFTKALRLHTRGIQQHGWAEGVLEAIWFVLWGSEVEEQRAANRDTVGNGNVLAVSGSSKWHATGINKKTRLPCLVLSRPRPRRAQPKSCAQSRPQVPDAKKAAEGKNPSLLPLPNPVILRWIVVMIAGYFDARRSSMFGLICLIRVSQWDIKSWFADLFSELNALEQPELFAVLHRDQCSILRTILKSTSVDVDQPESRSTCATPEGAWLWFLGSFSNLFHASRTSSTRSPRADMLWYF
ncbi:hypothetical protein KCU83_g345, partial [Aureobasidium melanogenum]